MSTKLYQLKVLGQGRSVILSFTSIGAMAEARTELHKAGFVVADPAPPTPIFRNGKEAVETAKLFLGS